MKTIEEMLRHLARPEVQELGMVSNRLPSVNVGGRFEPVDDRAPTTEAVLQMLVAVGGSRYVDTLGARPVQWTTRVDGLGVVAVLAVLRGDAVQVRFTLQQRGAARRDPRAEPGETPVAAPVRPIHAPTVKLASQPRLPVTVPPVREPMRTLESATDVTRPDVVLAERTTSAQHTAVTAPPSDVRVPPAAAPSSGDPLPPIPESTPEITGVLRVSTTATADPGRPQDFALLAPLVAAARDAKASDILIVAGRPLLLRVATELVPHGAALSAEHVEAMLAAVPSRLLPILASDGACDFAIDAAVLPARYRVNVVRQRTGYKLTLRVVPRQVPTLASLGLPEAISQATQHHQGLILLTGPTGHGKTSTLAALVDILNRTTTHHVLTVEDPIEFLHSRKSALISQREIGTHARSFASALKASLREDPDVICVGELRDTETVRMAVAASETGHLVIATMNTPSAAKTIDRLIDMFPPADQPQIRMTLAASLRLIVSQRLVPAIEPKQLVAAAELLPSSIALYTLIRDGRTFQIPSLQQRGRALGIVRLDDSLAALVRDGKVALDVAKTFAESPSELEALVAGRGAPAPAPPGLFGGRKG